MSLMRDSAVVAFRIYQLLKLFATINVLSVDDNIGLNLFTLKETYRYTLLWNIDGGAVQFGATSGG